MPFFFFFTTHMPFMSYYDYYLRVFDHLYGCLPLLTILVDNFVNNIIQLGFFPKVYSVLRCVQVRYLIKKLPIYYQK